MQAAELVSRAQDPVAERQFGYNVLDYLAKNRLRANAGNTVVYSTLAKFEVQVQPFSIILYHLAGFEPFVGKPGTWLNPFVLQALFHRDLRGAKTINP